MSLGSLTHWKEDAKSRVFWRDVVTEAVATFCLLSVQCSVPLSWGKENVYGQNLQGAIGMAGIVIAMIETFGPMGGAHMNPAVTLALLVARRITVFRVVVYIPVQVVTSIAGSAFIYWATPEHYRDTLAGTLVPEGISDGKALIAEIWLTFILLTTIFGAENSGRKHVYIPAIPIGCIVALAGLTGYAYSGASMNPVRSLGPAFMMNLWEHHWIYWVGPITGAILAAVLYLYVFDRLKDQSLEEHKQGNKVPNKELSTPTDIEKR